MSKRPKQWYQALGPVNSGDGGKYLARSAEKAVKLAHLAGKNFVTHALLSAPPASSTPDWQYPQQMNTAGLKQDEIQRVLSTKDGQRSHEDEIEYRTLIFGAPD